MKAMSIGGARNFFQGDRIKLKRINFHDIILDYWDILILVVEIYDHILRKQYSIFLDHIELFKWFNILSLTILDGGLNTFNSWTLFKLKIWFNKNKILINKHLAII